MIAALVAAVLAAAVAVAQEPQIGVSPPRVEVFLDEGPSTQAVRLYNFGDDPVGVRVTTANWELDEDNQVRDVEPTEQSADQWLVLNPIQFVVEPGRTQVVRFAVRPRVEPTAGEHRAMIYFEQDASLIDEDAPGMKVLFRVGVAVYAYAGEVRREGVLHEVRVDPGPDLVLDVGSQGNAHVRLVGTWAVWPAEAYPGAEATAVADPASEPEPPVLAHGLLPEGPVLAPSRRILTAELPDDLPPGDYVVDVHGSLSGAPVDRGVAFEVVANEEAAQSAPAPADTASDNSDGLPDPQ